MKSNEFFKETQEKIKKSKPNKEEKKVLEERGFDWKKDKDAYKEALLAYRKELADKKAEEEKNKPKPETDLDVLKEIRELLKENKEKK